MMARFRRFALAAVAISFVLVSSACVGCDYAATSPEDVIEFHIEVTNGGTTTFSFYEDALALPIPDVITAGTTFTPAHDYIGKQGDTFSFTFYDATGKTVLSPNNKCVLNNATVQLVFRREVKLDLDGKTFHCINWGD